ncbi:NAD(P)/FAD-dependent oxidoreductase [Massilia rubra]|uniref:FAD-dependent oxidoreductase n=1 Tax=Massilia rubra TaxID=2607910 RepID=A0ABX0LRN3_9BURK|nr:FAD-dependent oxidoreductase [Massilia rubra]
MDRHPGARRPWAFLLACALMAALRACDVVIAGAGPAGLAAAITCVQGGLQACIVTRSPLPARTRPSPMQSLHPKAMPLLAQLGAAPVLDACTEALFDRIASGSATHTFSAYGPLPVYGYHVKREKFDQELLNIAMQAGIPVYFDPVGDVIVDDGHVVGVITRSGAQLHARAVIDATGYARVLARRLGHVSRPCSPAFVVHTGLIDADAAFPMRGATRFEGRADGWSWFATAASGAVTWTSLHVRAAPHDTTTQLARCSVPGSVSAFDASWKLTRPLAARGILMAGEAAGRLDPAWGQGIVNALESGIAAAATVLDSAASPALAAWLWADYDAWFVARHEEACGELGSYYARQGIAILDGRFVSSPSGGL